TTFGWAYLKSRSSTSFTSEMKDFIRPRSISLTNCGSISIHKQDDLGAPLGGAGFTLYNDNAPTGGLRGLEDTSTGLTCATNAVTGDCAPSFVNLQLHGYWVVETTVPPAHNAVADRNVVLDQNNTSVSLILTDNRAPSTITINKVDDAMPPNPVPGAGFTLYNDNAPVGVTRGVEDVATAKTCTTGATGACSPN